MKKIAVLSFFFLTLLISTQAQDTTVSQNKDTISEAPYATVYVYRLKNYTGSLISYNIHLNDSVLCRIKNNTKYAIKVYKEGPGELWAETEQKRKVKVDIKFGQSYYLRCGVSMGVFAGRPDLTLVYPEQGKLDYDNLDAKNTKNKE